MKTLITIILAFIFFPLAMWYEARYVKKDQEIEDSIPERNKDGYLI